MDYMNFKEDEIVYLKSNGKEVKVKIKKRVYDQYFRRYEYIVEMVEHPMFKAEVLRESCYKKGDIKSKLD